MEIVVLAGAEADLFEAWRRYEGCLPGLGNEFDRAVRAGLLSVVQFPESAPHFEAGYRRLLLRRFGHGIFYRVHGERLVVVAVLDLRQDPAMIRQRLVIS